MRNKKGSSFNRQVARGADTRATNIINNNGADAQKNRRKSTKGHYRTVFTRSFDKMTERDIELRKQYAIDLISEEIAVPKDLITLRSKRDGTVQTLTSVDEVFYVKVGTNIYGKVSIRTQRMRNYAILVFVYQSKGTAPAKRKRPYTGKMTYEKATKSQRNQSQRNSWNNRRRGTN